MRHGSLFSGIGGAELAAEWAGWDNVFHCEINPFGRKVLDYYWPKSVSYEDITKTDFSIWRGKCDIITGGFPCQPFSMAGKRKGTEDNRHLWPEMLRVIREVQPEWVVGENVFGFVNWDGGMVFDQVQADLEAEGYEVIPFILPAVSVNAPHKRDRVWIVAHATIPGREERIESGGREDPAKVGTWMDNRPERFGEMGITSDPSIERCDNGGNYWKERCIQANNRTAKKSESERYGWECGLGEIGSIITDPCNQGLQGRKNDRSIAGFGEERNEQPARFFRTGWENFPTQSPVRERNDGLPDRLVGITFPKWRNEAIKAMGNAWVPQVAYQIFKAINLYNFENGA